MRVVHVSVSCDLCLFGLLPGGGEGPFAPEPLALGGDGKSTGKYGEAVQTGILSMMFLGCPFIVVYSTVSS